MSAKNSKQIRIISGECSGRYIDTPKNTVTKPMGERERLAIFNQIREYIDGANVLDAFAGSGALGLTALSNNAAAVDFLENNPEAIRTIKQNLIKLKYDKKAQIVRKVDNLANYELIFADPPYDNIQIALVEKIAAHLVDGGIFVLSHPKDAELPEFGELELMSDRSYAAAQIKIYRKK